MLGFIVFAATEGSAPIRFLQTGNYEHSVHFDGRVIRRRITEARACDLGGELFCKQLRIDRPQKKEQPN